VNRFARTSLSIVTMVSALALSLPQAEAQTRLRNTQRQTVLVTPEGSILDFTPEADEVIIKRDRQGRRVLIDNYGNLVATEMPADAYFASSDGSDVGDDTAAYDDGGFDARDPGTITGSVPRYPDSGSIERLPLNDPEAPQFGSEPDYGSNPDTQQDYGAIDPKPANPVIEDKEPVIKLTNSSRAEITALQAFLDRQGASPGVIDGKMGANVTKALSAWEKISGETLDPNNTEDVLERLRLSGGMPIVSYQITPADAAGPYVAEIPEDYSQKALLPGLNYTSTAEMLAEKFHMDEGYLRELNPNVDFTIPGTTIKVVNPGEARTGNVTKILADKGRKQVLAYGEAGELIAAYPASIGSADTPSPSGLVTVERVALNPGYTYNPKINFQQAGNDKILNIPPGPNGPVGTVWMALSKPTYGIHGTPEPSKIGRTQSHGCIRLTNWDATELAKMVKPGVTVEFVD